MKSTQTEAGRNQEEKKVDKNQKTRGKKYRYITPEMMAEYDDMIGSCRI